MWQGERRGSVRRAYCNHDWAAGRKHAPASAFITPSPRHLYSLPMSRHTHNTSEREHHPDVCRQHRTSTSTSGTPRSILGGASDSLEPPLGGSVAYARTCVRFCCQRCKYWLRACGEHGVVSGQRRAGQCLAKAEQRSSLARSGRPPTLAATEMKPGGTHELGARSAEGGEGRAGEHIFLMSDGEM